MYFNARFEVGRFLVTLTSEKNCLLVCFFCSCLKPDCSISSKSTSAHDNNLGLYQKNNLTSFEVELRVDFQEHGFCWSAECLSSVGGRSTEKAHVSWLIVSRGFSGRRVFHNDMERPCDMHERCIQLSHFLFPIPHFLWTL